MRGDDVGGPIRWKLHLSVSLATDEGGASFWAESAIERDRTIHFTFSNGAAYESRVHDRERLWDDGCSDA